MSLISLDRGRFASPQNYEVENTTKFVVYRLHGRQNIPIQITFGSKVYTVCIHGYLRNSTADAGLAKRTATQLFISRCCFIDHYKLKPMHQVSACFWISQSPITHCAVQIAVHRNRQLVDVVGLSTSERVYYVAGSAQ